MIQVKVRLFATLRQQAGWSERQISAPDGCTLSELLSLISESTPNLNLTGRTVYAAVNQNYVKGEQFLANGDEVAIFPPVSGGNTVSCWDAETG